MQIQAAVEAVDSLDVLINNAGVAALSELAVTNSNIRTEVADATDATVAGSFIERYKPQAVVLVAGGSPSSLRCRSGSRWHADLGRPAVKASAARRGHTEEEYVHQFGEPLTPEVAGAAIVELVEADAATLERAYLLTSVGAQPARPWV